MKSRNYSVTDPEELFSRMAEAWHKDKIPQDSSKSGGFGCIWPDLMIDSYPGDPPFELERCFLCGKEGFYDINHTGIDGGIRSRPSLWDAAFHGRHSHEFTYATVCDACAPRLPAIIFRFREVDELNFYINALKKAIYERRNQNNRSASAHASQCRQRGNERDSGH